MPGRRARCSATKDRPFSPLRPATPTLSTPLAGAAYFGAKVLILDEPTSAVGVRRTSNVLATIDRVCNQGVVFITQHVRHCLAVGDRFTLLNRGRTLGTAKRVKISPEQLQDLMAGGQEPAELEGSLGGTVRSVPARVG